MYNKEIDLNISYNIHIKFLFFPKENEMLLKNIGDYIKIIQAYKN